MMGRLARAGTLGLVMLTVSACSRDDVAKLPAPPSTVLVATTTTGPDLAGVGLPVANGRTTTTIAITGGAAKLEGVVAAPEGAVPGATVRLERLVGDAVAFVELQTNPDGTWFAPDIRGGRYRIRAWRTPDLAMTKPQIVFVEAKETRALTLKVATYQGVAVTSDIAPNPPEVNAPASLVALVAVRSVDAQGIVRANPIAGVRIELSGSGWRLDTQNANVTDANGQARWQIRCRGEGRQPLSAIVDQESTHPLELPDCLPSTAPPSTASTTSTTFRAPTSTTRRTTSTTS